MKTITASQLAKLGACHEQLATFRDLFGSGVAPTLELCLTHASRFEWDWAAEHLLTAPARAEYHKADAAAWAEYDKARAAAFFHAYTNQ